LAQLSRTLTVFSTCSAFPLTTPPSVLRCNSKKLQAIMDHDS